MNELVRKCIKEYDTDKNRESSIYSNGFTGERRVRLREGEGETRKERVR